MEAKDFTKGAFVGGIVGAMAGILFAPKSGKETREDIKKYYDEMRDKIMEELEKAGDFTKEKYDSIVRSVVSKYQDEDKITSNDSERIMKILSESFNKIEKITAKKIKEIKEETE